MFTCPLCESELLLAENGSRPLQRCVYCGTEEDCEWRCPLGCYVCEECRAASPEVLVERTCLATAEQDPVVVAELLMRHPVFRGHGPAHHLVAGPALLTACRNYGRPLRPGAISAAVRRLRNIPLGSCGSRGDCGACVGVGCAVSLLTGATYRADKERSLSLKGTAAALARLAELGGPRCCKQAVYSAIEAGVDYLRKELGIILPASLPPQCKFTEAVPDCKGASCAYYRAK